MSQIYRTYEDFDYDKLNLYAGLDCIVTSELLSALAPKLMERPVFKEDERKAIRLDSLWEVNQRVNLPALEYIIDMEINGMEYDVKRNREINDQMVSEIARLEDDIFRMIGVPKFNMFSSKELTSFLYGDMGLTPPYTTAKGEPATDGDALLTLAGIDPKEPGNYIPSNPDLQYLAWMAKYKDIASAHNMFIKTYVEDFVRRDGRIHASYHLTGTSSFRITGELPNLTQLPRPKHGYNIRECYSVKPGYVFIAADFSSAEVKILANICKDPAMMKAVADGLDFHSYSASAMLGVPYEDFVGVLKEKGHREYKRYKSFRQIAKILTFSILYGSSAGGISMQLGVSKEQAEEYISMYFKAYPGMKTYIDRIHKQALLNQMIVTPFGQRRQEYGTFPEFKYTAPYNAALRNSQNVNNCVEY